MSAQGQAKPEKKNAGVQAGKAVSGLPHTETEHGAVGPHQPEGSGVPTGPTQANNPSGETAHSRQALVATAEPTTDTDDRTAANLEALLELAVNDKHIKVAVRRLEGAAGKKVYIAVLAGTLHSKKASLQAQAKVEEIKARSGLDNVIVVNSLDAEDPEKGEIEVAYLWPCGFLQGDTDFDNKISLINLADGLNTIFPCEPDGVPVVTVKDTNLWLHGPQNTVRKVRAILAMIDAPTPEVKLEVWAIQYAGSQKDIGSRIQSLNTEIAQARHAAEMAKLCRKTPRH